VCANKKRSGVKYGERGEKFYSIVDACIAASYFQLAIADKGLGTVWVGAFDDKKVMQILDLPIHITPVGIFPVGHPREHILEKKIRRPINKCVHKEKYGAFD
jgi:nitroreductase